MVLSAVHRGSVRACIGRLLFYQRCSVYDQVLLFFFFFFCHGSRLRRAVLEHFNLEIPEDREPTEEEEEIRQVHPITQQRQHS